MNNFMFGFVAAIGLLCIILVVCVFFDLYLTKREEKVKRTMMQFCKNEIGKYL